MNHDQIHTPNSNPQNPAQRNINQPTSNNQRPNLVHDSSLSNLQSKSIGFISSNFAQDQLSAKPFNVKYVDYFGNKEPNNNDEELKSKEVSLGTKTDRIPSDKNFPPKTVTVYKTFTRESSDEKRTMSPTDTRKYTGHPYFIPFQNK